MRGEHRLRRLRLPRRPGQLAGLRRGALPGDRRGGARRPDQDRVRADDRRDPLHGADLGRDRRAVAKLDLDLHPRRRPEVHLRRRQLLRRPGLHGVEGPRRHLGGRARRRHRLRADRHDDRAQPRRLLQDQQHRLPAGADPDPGRGRPAVPRRRLRRLHHRRLAARDPARHLREPRQLRHPARDHLQGAARPGGAPGRRPVGGHRALDAECAGRRRGVRRDRRQRRGDGAVREPGSPAPARHRGRPRDDARARRRVGEARDHGQRQLRRDLRRDDRRGHALEHRPRPQCASGPKEDCSTRRPSAEPTRGRATRRALRSGPATGAGRVDTRGIGHDHRRDAASAVPPEHAPLRHAVPFPDHPGGRADRLHDLRRLAGQQHRREPRRARQDLQLQLPLAAAPATTSARR